MVWPFNPAAAQLCILHPQHSGTYDQRAAREASRQALWPNPGTIPVMHLAHLCQNQLEHTILYIQWYGATGSSKHNSNCLFVTLEHGHSHQYGLSRKPGPVRIFPLHHTHTLGASVDRRSLGNALRHCFQHQLSGKVEHPWCWIQACPYHIMKIVHASES